MQVLSQNCKFLHIAIDRCSIIDVVSPLIIIFTNKTMPKTIDAEGDISPESQGRLGAILKTEGLQERDLERALAHMRKNTGAEAATVVEVVNHQLLTLFEADNFLRKHNIPINLFKAREEDVRDMLRWGAIHKKDADQYGAAFDNPQIPEQALLALATELKTDSSLAWEPVFELENRTDAQAYDEDIVKSGINHCEYRTLPLYRRIDPKTKRTLPDQRPTNKAHVVFTPDMLNANPRFTNISANAQLKKMAERHKYMPPSRWIKCFLRSVDTGLRALYHDKDINKMEFEAYKAFRASVLKQRASGGSYPIDRYLLDTLTVTQFPDLRSIEGLNENQIKNGDLSSAVAPSLGFYAHPVTRRVDLYYVGPSNPRKNIGGRPELG